MVVPEVRPHGTETVVNALECYASNEGAVYLVGFRSR